MHGEDRRAVVRSRQQDLFLVLVVGVVVDGVVTGRERGLRGEFFLRSLGGESVWKQALFAACKWMFKANYCYYYCFYYCCYCCCYSYYYYYYCYYYYYYCCYCYCRCCCCCCYYYCYYCCCCYCY